MLDDTNLVCKSCGKDFILTEGEQEFYSIKGFPNPKRCKDCRSARKLHHNKTY